MFPVTDFGLDVVRQFKWIPIGWVELMNSQRKTRFNSIEPDDCGDVVVGILINVYIYISVRNVRSVDWLTVSSAELIWFLVCLFYFLAIVYIPNYKYKKQNRKKTKRAHELPSEYLCACVCEFEVIFWLSTRIIIILCLILIALKRLMYSPFTIHCIKYCELFFKFYLLWWCCEDSVW